ncbi:hypothetical protein ACOSP7_002977 [Xanthoceras sorbifolium]
MTECRAIIQQAWAGQTVDSPLISVVSKLLACAASLDIWNCTSLQYLRREIACTRGRIRRLGLSPNVSSWRDLNLMK